MVTPAAERGTGRCAPVLKGACSTRLGSDEALLPVNLDGLEDHVTDLEIVRVPEANHFVIWEQPDRVNAALTEFLERT